MSGSQEGGEIERSDVVHRQPRVREVFKTPGFYLLTVLSYLVIYYADNMVLDTPDPWFEPLLMVISAAGSSLIFTKIAMRGFYIKKEVDDV